MPVGSVRHKHGRGLGELAAKLTEALPGIVAPALSIEGREIHDGKVTPDEIIIRCEEGTGADANAKDLEIMIFAHDFPERSANLEDRKKIVLEGVLAFLADWDRNVTGFVWVILAPTAFGSF
ncbi:MAG: hypothetical protein WDN10_00990 [bacterium]